MELYVIGSLIIIALLWRSRAKAIKEGQKIDEKYRWTSKAFAELQKVTGLEVHSWDKNTHYLQHRYTPDHNPIAVRMVKVLVEKVNEGSVMDGMRPAQVEVSYEHCL